MPAKVLSLAITLSDFDFSSESSISFFFRALVIATWGGMGISFPLLFPLYGPSELCSPSTDYMNLQGGDISNKNLKGSLALYVDGTIDRCTSFEVFFPNGNSGSITPANHPKKEIRAFFHFQDGFQQEQAIKKYDGANQFLRVDAGKLRDFERAVQVYEQRPKRFVAFEKEMEHFDHKRFLDHFWFEAR